MPPTSLPPVFGNSTAVLQMMFGKFYKTILTFVVIAVIGGPGPGHQIAVKNGRTTTRAQTQLEWNFYFAGSVLVVTGYNYSDESTQEHLMLIGPFSLLKLDICPSRVAFATANCEIKYFVTVGCRSFDKYSWPGSILTWAVSVSCVLYICQCNSWKLSQTSMLINWSKYVICQTFLLFAAFCPNIPNLLQ